MAIVLQWTISTINIKLSIYNSLLWQCFKVEKKKSFFFVLFFCCTFCKQFIKRNHLKLPVFAFINVLAWVLFYRIQGLNSAVYALGFLFLIWSPFRRCDTGCSHYINQYRSNFWMTWHVKIYAKSFILEVNRAALFLLILVVTRHLIGWYSWRDMYYIL